MSGSWARLDRVTGAARRLPAAHRLTSPSPGPHQEAVNA
jgi:hypothetical protein